MPARKIALREVIPVYKWHLKISKKENLRDGRCMLELDLEQV